MVRISLGDQIEFDRVHVDDDSYVGKIVEVSDVYQGTDFNGQPKEKLCLYVETESGVKLPKFVSAVVSAAGERNPARRNSVLYDMLKASGNLERFMDASVELTNARRTQEQTNKLFVELLRQLFVDKRVNVKTKTVTPKDDSEKYSTVDEIIRFLDDAPIKEETVAPGAAKAA